MQVGTVRIAVRGPIEHAVLDISGELDFANVEEIVELVAELPHRLAAIDLSGLEFIDGAGVRAIELVRDAREELHDQRPDVTGARRDVERTMRFVRSRAARMVAT